jgi:hypothetical protein
VIKDIHCVKDSPQSCQWPHLLVRLDLRIVRVIGLESIAAVRRLDDTTQQILILAGVVTLDGDDLSVEGTGLSRCNPLQQ